MPNAPMILQFTNIPMNYIINLPISGLNGGDITVVWGDGITNTNTLSHTYTIADDYTVSITLASGASITTFGIYNWVGSSKLTTISQWGDLPGLTILSYIGGAALISVPPTIPSSVINTSLMFSGATNFNQSLNTWNVSNITNMSSMFINTTNFNQPLNDWNVSNVTGMDYMFYGATSFNQSLNNWNVVQVTHMNGMFFNATSFNQSLNDWNVSNVTNMSNMFYNAISFNQSLNNWNVSNVTSMPLMFYGATNFNILNFSNTLHGWVALPNLQTNVYFASPLHYTIYTFANDAYNILINSYNWTFNQPLAIVFNPNLIVSYNQPITRIYKKQTTIYSYTPVFYNNYSTINFSIIPSLPAGLIISSSTGIISGTPLTVQSTTEYTITTTNSNNDTITNTINFAVIEPDFYYESSIYIFINNIVINTISPIVNGSLIISNYEIIPALPSGLIINTNTGTISGTPITNTYNQNYTITLTTSNNTLLYTITLKIADISYAAATYNFLAAVAIETIQPATFSLHGGATIALATPLPSGFAFNAETGKITGTPPAAALAATTYNLTLTIPNTTYTKTIPLTFTVADISYAAVSYVYAQNTEFLYSPFNGKPIIPIKYDFALFESILLNNTLPINLAIDLSDGIIYGIPYTATAEKKYSLTAKTYSGYTKNISLSIAVNGFSYTEDGSEPEYNLTVNDTIKIILVQNIGNYTDFIITPNLPNGLHLDSITGTISGKVLSDNIGSSKEYYISGLVYPIITIAITISIILPQFSCEWKCPSSVIIPRPITTINTRAMRYSSLVRTGLGQTRYLANNNGININKTYTEPATNHF